MVAASALAACAIPSERDAATAGAAHLSPPSRPATGLCRAGEERLDVGSPRPALLYVPKAAATRSSEGTGSPLLFFFQNSRKELFAMISIDTLPRSLRSDKGCVPY